MQLVKGKCPKCQAIVEFGVADPPRLVNLETCSMATVSHSGPVVCSCLTRLQPVMIQVGGVIIGLVPVQEPQKQLVIPAGGMNDNGFKG